MSEEKLFFERGNKVYGHFADLLTPAGQAKRLSLCSLKERNKYSNKGTPSPRDRFLIRLWEERLEKELQKKKSGATADSIQELIDNYIDEKDPDITVQGQLKYWRKELPNMKAKEVEPYNIVLVQDLLKKRVGPASVNRYRSAISAVFTYCVKEKFILDHNPVKIVPKLKEPRGRTRFLSFKERKQLEAECRKSSNPDLYLVVMLALSTGGREGEIWGLKWNDVDLKNGSVIFRDTKNGDTRRISFDGPALTEFRNKIRRIDTELVFPGKWDKNKPRSFRKPFEQAVQAAGLEDFTFHDLRHTFASYMAMDGATLREIADALGHRTLNMVMRYSHLTEEHSSKVVKGMNQRMLA